MSRRSLDELADRCTAKVQSDGIGFRRAARILQSLWREERGFTAGDHGGVPLGSRLSESFARDTLLNYLTPTIRDVVATTIANQDSGQLFSEPRIYNDLLSSQPLCFNLFGELQRNLSLATEVFTVLRPDTVRSVTSIQFEYSRSRSDPKFTDDRSAFDVFVEYIGLDGSNSFFGIEVKYHENLRENPAPHRPRYDEIAAAMGCFRDECLDVLREAPLQQIWRDHLLAGATQVAGGYSAGRFVFLYPAANTHCRRAVQCYRACLRDETSFESWTLEEVIAVLSLATTDSWVREFRKRYLDFDRLGSGGAA